MRQSFADTTLLAVQRCLLRLCAARGDIMAVLSLPEHYREREALAHAATLKASTAAAINVDGTPVLPLGYGEARSFSYGAIFHPWPVSRDDDRGPILLRTPPDGAACGMIAARALGRGAWVAPANELLQGMIALAPAVPPAALLDLLTAQVNVLRQEPRGFVTLSADTLSDDPDLRPINVRRLLILLRRLAVRHGATYVFEPNGPAFHRLVQRQFEALMRLLFVRGAFAGDRPATAYQVVAGASPQDMDAGRFYVELKVAPSLPLTFLTIRLVQSGERGFVTEGR